MFSRLHRLTCEESTHCLSHASAFWVLGPIIVQHVEHNGVAFSHRESLVGVLKELDVAVQEEDVGAAWNVVEVEQKLLKFVPKEFLMDAHHWLILHGRYTCVARKPRCGSCLIEDLCEFKQKTDE